MRSKIVAGAAALAAVAFMAATPVQAQRWHGHHGGWHHHGGWDRGGAAVGAGIAGLAAGALIGSALAPRYYTPGYSYGYAEVPADSSAVAYCMQRFKSYDPASGTYLGYDGIRHPCP